jgi:ClpP class serine protease
MPLLTQAELTPPDAVRDAARKGVELHDAGKSGDGLKPETVRRANSIAAGEPQSEEWATVEAPAWFARHESDFERGEDDRAGEESPGYVAWLLWGGDPGRKWVEQLRDTWAERRAEEMDDEQEARTSAGVAALAVEPSFVAQLSRERSARAALPGAVGVVHLEGGLYPYDYHAARLEMRAAALQGEPVVVLQVDSPGGYVAGVRETRRAIAQAQSKGIYVVAYVSGMACSAALWVASAADEIVLSPLAQVGSVGVVLTLAENDDDVVEVVSSQTPRKRQQLGDNEYMAALQARVDKLAQVMLDDIAGDRGVPADALGGGSTFSADDAVARGMADRIASDDDDWLFLGGSMPATYARKVRTASASASTLGGHMEALDMSEQNTTAQTVDAAQVDALRSELDAVRAQLDAARADIVRRDAAAVVEQAIAETRIAQGSRDAWVARAERLGVDEVRAMLADLPVMAQVGNATGHGATADIERNNDPRAVEVERANQLLARFRAVKGA